MQHDTIFHSRKIDRDYVGLPLLHKRYMADQGFIQDAMDGLAVVIPTLGESSNAVAVGPGEIGHYYSFRFSSILQYQAFSNLPCLISRHETVQSFFHGRPFRGHNGKASRVTRDNVSRHTMSSQNSLELTTDTCQRRAGALITHIRVETDPKHLPDFEGIGQQHKSRSIFIYSAPCNM